MTDLKGQKRGASPFQRRCTRRFRHVWRNRIRTGWSTG